MVTNILITLAVTYLLSKSPLLNTPREWLADRHWILSELIHCKICLSFWVGLYLTSSISEALVIMGVFVLINIYETKI